MTVEQQIEEAVLNYEIEVSSIERRLRKGWLTPNVAEMQINKQQEDFKAKLLQIVRPDEWWISTDFFNRGGLKVLGPFQSQELALEVRTLLEHASKPKTYAVDVLKGGE